LKELFNKKLEYLKNYKNIYFQKNIKFNYFSFFSRNHQILITKQFKLSDDPYFFAMLIIFYEETPIELVNNSSSYIYAGLIKFHSPSDPNTTNLSIFLISILLQLGIAIIP